jgi:5-(carboxyamino)imidazole ribonucleotide synthase
MSKIGIIGGGQLGLMMAQSAKRMGHTIMSLDPNQHSPITLISDCHISKAYNDREAIQYMAEKCDVITYEFENVDLNILKPYIEKIPQKLKALEISSNRLKEKDFAKNLDIPTPKYKSLETKQDIMIPSIIKTTSGGYDGKGQFRIKSKSDIDHFIINSDYSYIIEELVDFDYEISCVASRDIFDNIEYQSIPVNKHKNGILHTSIIEENIPQDIVALAHEYTKKVLVSLDYVGTLAVEYFVKDNVVYFNEFAPRPHNSGHYSIDACEVSQFDNHVLAIVGEKVKSSNLISNCIMINILGQNSDLLGHVFPSEMRVYTFDYGKHSSIHNRKVGHITYMFKNHFEKEKFIRYIEEVTI